MSIAIFRGGTFASLRKYRNFRLYFCGQAVSAIGTWIQDTTLPWLVLQLTHSPTKVGAILAFSTTVVWPFFVLATLGGIGTILDAPSKQAFTSRLVAREDLLNAVALNSSMFSAAILVGPAVGGVLIAAAGAGWCFAVNAISFLALLVSLLLIRVHSRSCSSPPPTISVAALSACSSSPGPDQRRLVLCFAGWLLHAGGTELALIVAGLAGLTTIAFATARVRKLPVRPGLVVPVEKAAP